MGGEGPSTFSPSLLPYQKNSTLTERLVGNDRFYLTFFKCTCLKQSIFQLSTKLIEF